MSEWKKVKLGDCIFTKKGFAFKSALYTNCGVPVVRVSDFTLDSVADNDLVYYPHAEKDRYDEYVLNEGDVLIQTVGSWQYNPNSVVGKVVRVPYYHKGSLLNQNIVKIIPNNGYNNAFIFYRLKCRDFAGHVLGEARGAANQASITLDTIKRFSFDCPLLSTQHRIATILSRYDSLIENYQKQIKLLEEAAQRLYKEWFVDLHFPGHENTNIIDGVPEGWKKMPVDSIYSIKYGKNLSTKLITPTGKYPVYGANGVIGYYNVANCNNQVVLITSRGNGSGDVLMTYHKDSFITNNSFVVSPLDDYSYCQLPFTYQFLKNANFRAVRTGAAQPQLTNQSIHTVDVILPSKGIIIDYCNKAFYSNKKIIILRIQIRLLTEARDRLLPKLMSGEITV